MKLDNEPFCSRIISCFLLRRARIRASASDAPCGMKLPRRIFHKAAVLPAAVLLLCAGMNPVHAADNSYYFCGFDRSVYHDFYLTAIFSGEEKYYLEESYGYPFVHYVGQQYNFYSALGYPHCFRFSSYQDAKDEYDAIVRRYKRRNWKIVQTNWSPDADDFTEQALQDFNITVSSGRQEVRVCVRDHECEDGDQVRVSVNGNVLFSGEIDNQWACSDVPVRKGSNRIEMYAVNGTGHKGEHCNHANVNTGEIQVGGKNVETQSWRHRGGAGSSADIVVEID